MGRTSSAGRLGRFTGRVLLLAAAAGLGLVLWNTWSVEEPLWQRPLSWLIRFSPKRVFKDAAWAAYRPEITGAVLVGAAALLLLLGRWGRVPRAACWLLALALAALGAWFVLGGRIG